MFKVAALIPARSGSKGIKDKNLTKIGGKTLLEWSINACKRCDSIGEIIISTDSEKYAEHASEMGGFVPFLRPKNISNDNSTDYEFFEHYLNWACENSSLPDLIAHIRPTTPFRDPKILEKAIRYYKDNEKKLTSIRSVHAMSESAYKTFEISNEGLLTTIFNHDSELDSSNNARQKFPLTYVANGYVDLISTEFTLKSKKIHGNKVLPFLTPTSHELDTIEDLDLLEFQLMKNSEIFAKVFS